MKLAAVFTIALVAFAAPLSAQGRGNERAKQGGDTSIPASARPPAGMCRIWLDDVPVNQQPAPTDCPTAVRNRPAKGRVIFGDDYVAPKRDTTGKKSPPIKGFTPPKSAKRRPLLVRPHD